MIFYLIYVSSAVQLLLDEELLLLLRQSQTKNLNLGITGMLLYSIPWSTSASCGRYSYLAHWGRDRALKKTEFTHRRGK